MGAISKEVASLRLEQGGLKSEVHQLKDTIQQLVSRFDARDHIDQDSPWFKGYRFEVQVNRECGMYAASAIINWVKDGPKEFKEIAKSPSTAILELFKKLAVVEPGKNNVFAKEYQP